MVYNCDEVDEMNRNDLLNEGVVPQNEKRIEKLIHHCIMNLNIIC